MADSSWRPHAGDLDDWRLLTARELRVARDVLAETLADGALTGEGIAEVFDLLLDPGPPEPPRPGILLGLPPLSWAIVGRSSRRSEGC